MLLSKLHKPSAEMIHFDLHYSPCYVGIHIVPTLHIRTPGHGAVKGPQMTLDVGSVATRPPPPTQDVARPVG